MSYQGTTNRVANSWINSLIEKKGSTGTYCYSITRTSPIQYQIYDFNTRRTDYKNIQGTAALICSLNASKAQRTVESELQSYPQYVPITIKSEIVCSASMNKKASLPQLWKKEKIDGHEFIVRATPEEIELEMKKETEVGKGKKKTASVKTSAVVLRLKKNDLGEYEVRWMEDGVQNEKKTYHTEDKQDAEMTMKKMQEDLDKKPSDKKAYFVWRPGDKRKLEDVREEAMAMLNEEAKDPEVQKLIQRVKEAKTPQEIEEAVSQIEYLELQ